jgi:hypothetical protein
MQLLTKFLIQRSLILPVLLIVLVSSAASFASESLESERQLWVIWKKHKSSQSEHKEIITQCNRMEQKCPNSSLLVPAKEIKAWHLFRLKQISSGYNLFNGIVNEYSLNPVVTAGKEVARRWLTRLDREKLRIYLKKYYTSNIRFPESLAVFARLPASKQPPLKDQWGHKWDYSLVNFKYLKGFNDQKYTLESKKLGNNSDFSEMINKPYKTSLEIEPVKTLKSGSQETIKFKVDGLKQNIILSEGSDVRGITLAYLGKRIIILSDGDYWVVMPKPH